MHRPKKNVIQVREASWRDPAWSQINFDSELFLVDRGFLSARRDDSSLPFPERFRRRKSTSIRGKDAERTAGFPLLRAYDTYSA